MKSTALWLVAVLVAAHSQAMNFGPFGPKGEGGTKNSQTFTLGTGGSVFELDSFLTVNGADLNGAQAGTSAQLSEHSLPAGLNFTFAAGISNAVDAVLTYTFANTSSDTFTNVCFAVMLDAEIDQEVNTFFNEYGGALGTIGAGAGDLAPDSWQIDEPGFVNGTLFTRLFTGNLGNTNAIPAGGSNDVAFGLGLQLGDLAPGQSTAVSVMISEAGHYFGGFALQQFDRNTNSATTVTLSAIVSTLTGNIFKDQNTNHIADPTEGLAGVRVLLLSNAVQVAQTLTDSGGNYSFNSPPAGDYTVRVDTTTLPGSLTNSVDPDGVLDNQTVVALAPGQLRILNWGYQSTSAQEFGDATALVSLNFTWRLKQTTGSLLGTVTITNLPTSGVTLSAPFRLGFPATATTNFWLAQPVGTLPNGLPYVDLTSGVSTGAPGGQLAPGQRVVLVDGVEIYSRNRSAPPPSLFQLWCTQQP